MNYLTAFILVLALPAISEASLIYDIDSVDGLGPPLLGSGQIALEADSGEAADADLLSFYFDLDEANAGTFTFTKSDINLIAWQHDASGNLRLSLSTVPVVVPESDRGIWGFDKLALYINWGGDSLLSSYTEVSCPPYSAIAGGGVANLNVVYVVGCSTKLATPFAGATGSYVELSDAVASVPTPATHLLLGLGLAALACRRKPRLFGSVDGQR